MTHGQRGKHIYSLGEKNSECTPTVLNLLKFLNLQGVVRGSRASAYYTELDHLPALGVVYMRLKYGHKAHFLQGLLAIRF